MPRTAKNGHDSLTHPSARLKFDDERFLSTEQAAKVLGVTRLTLYNYTQSGRLQPYKRGKFRFFKEQDVKALLVPQPVEPKKTRKRRSTTVR